MRSAALRSSGPTFRQRLPFDIAHDEEDDDDDAHWRRCAEMENAASLLTMAPLLAALAERWDCSRE